MSTSTIEKRLNDLAQEIGMLRSAVSAWSAKPTRKATIGRNLSRKC